MSMKRSLLAGVAGAALLGGVAMADQPMQLTDSEMDAVTAGFLSNISGSLFLNAGVAKTGFTYSKFKSSTSLGVANVKSSSKVETSTSSSLNITPTSSSSNESSTANAKATNSFDGSSLSYGKYLSKGSFAGAGQLLLVVNPLPD